MIILPMLKCSDVLHRSLTDTQSHFLEAHIQFNELTPKKDLLVGDIALFSIQAINRFFFLFLILNQRFKYSRNHLACPDLEAIYYEQYHFTDGWRDLPIVTQLGNGWNRTA